MNKFSQFSSLLTRRQTLISLVLVNLWPLYKVAIGDWGMLDIFFLYWIETVAIGIINIPKMWYVGYFKYKKHGKIDARPKAVLILINMAMTAFFMLHFGGFTGGYLAFIFGISSDSNLAQYLQGDKASLALLWWLPVFLFSHGHSFFVNFIRKKEYQNKAIGDQMMTPYKRIIVMHISLVFGTMLMTVFKAPLAFFTFFIGIKIFMDIKKHEKEHPEII